MRRKGASSRLLSHSSLALFLLVVSASCSDAKVTCMKAPGKNSAGDTCEGDYCMFAELPGIDQPVRGCLSGDLLKADIKDQCERSEIGSKEVCICSAKSGCNINPNAIKRERMKLVKCYDCEKNCSAETFCYGEYCTLVKYANGKIVRGCSNPSMPLFERKGLGSCVTPSFPSHTEQRHWDASTLRAITCTCNDRSYCNGPVLTKQIRAGSKSKKCQVRAYANTKMGRHPSPTVPDCEGEHCFNILVEMGEVTTNVSGCMSFLKLDNKKAANKLPEHEELNDRGCMTIDSETLRARACFDTEDRREDDGGDDDDEENSKAPGEVNDEAPSSGNADEARNRNGDKSRKEGKPRAHPLARNRTPKERPNPEDETDSSKKEEELASEPAKQNSFIQADTDPEQPVMKPESEGNTAIVAVFVAIMVLIVIAGVVWKFELHKKIFHARYQTVAG